MLISASQLPAPNLDSALRAQAGGATFGPGLIEGHGTANPTVLRVISTTISSAPYSIHIQNIGDSTIMLVQHTSTGQSQLGQVPSESGSSFLLDLAPGDRLQVIGQGDGSETRCIWSGKKL